MAYVIALHGGAGVNPSRDYGEVVAHLDGLVRDCENRLAAGDPALDVVEHAVACMEESGLYVAGRGSGPNTAGAIECDAAIMDGARMRAGGVCAMTDIVSPIAAARAVLEESSSVLLAGDGARDFAIGQGLDRVTDVDAFYRVPVGVEPEEMLPGAEGPAHGTVGAVALDCDGRLAAATSTGGIFGKRAGRIGDTPIIGVGTWADGDVAISCTGIGEAFIYAGGARDIAARMRYGGSDLEDAARAMLASVERFGGDGGLIAIDRSGRVAMPFNSPGMKRAVAGRNLDPVVRIGS